jgi:hypothetical protein
VWGFDIIIEADLVAVCCPTMLDGRLEGGEGLKARDAGEGANILSLPM